MKQVEWDKLYSDAYKWVLVYGLRFIVAMTILFAGIWLSRLLLKRLHYIMDKRNVDVSLKPFLLSITNIALKLILFLIVVKTLGITLTIFTSLLAALGVAAGLALSGTLQNFTSGILILLFKPYRVGDSIIAQGQEGLVDSIQIFYTVVTTYDNKTVIIPNSKLSNEVIINISREGIRRLDVEFKFGFGADFNAIDAILKESVNGMSYLLKNPIPRTGVSAIEADGFRISVNIWVNAHGFQDVKLQFQEKLIADLKAKGIKLPGMV